MYTKKLTIKSPLIKNLILVVIAIGIAILPLIISKNTSFRGSDDKAETVISQVNPNYKPWFSSFWAPSKEMEGSLFALQAAIGAGIIGYILGYLKGKAKKNEGL